MVQKNSTGTYIETKVLTASPEQLQMMLYDGAIRFCEQARPAIENKEIEKSYLLLQKAQNIVMELTNTMRDELAPEACANMRRLYIFCYDRLVVANIKKDLIALDEALKVLHHIRQTWVLLMEKLTQERVEKNAGKPSTPPRNEAGPDNLENALVGGSINFQG